MVPYLYSRWNIHTWRDVWEVCCLRLPPYRWYHCIPLTCFSLGFQRPRSGWIVMIGMWGLKFKTRENFPVTVSK